MTARIYQRPKSAMQSGKARVDEWVLEFEQSEARRADPLLLIGSNIAAIAAWLALLFLPANVIPLAISVLFALLLLLDWRAYSQGTVPLSYLRLRMAITSAVVICLGVLVAAN